MASVGQLAKLQSAVTSGRPAVLTAPVLSGLERRATHRAARLGRVQRGERTRTAVFVNVGAAVETAFTGSQSQEVSANTCIFSIETLTSNLVRNEQVSRRHLEKAAGWLHVEKRLGVSEEGVLNFVPLDRVKTEFMSALVDRAARERVTGQSRGSLIEERLREPEIMCEEGGTPRREFQEGVVAGVRVRAV